MCLCQVNYKRLILDKSFIDDTKMAELYVTFRKTRRLCIIFPHQYRFIHDVTDDNECINASIGRPPRQRFLDHAFMLHCTILPHSLAQWGVRLKRVRSMAAFNVTLLIMVLEIPCSFQFDAMCWECHFQCQFPGQHKFSAIFLRDIPQQDQRA